MIRRIVTTLLKKRREQRFSNASVEEAIKSQRHAEEGLRRSEEHFAELVAGVRDYGIFLLDRQGYILSWNSGAATINGYRAEEIVGQHFSRFYPQEAVASGWPAHELEVASSTGRFEEESWRIRKDGTRFWANVVITALRDDSGEVRGFLKITRDLTDRKQAEEKLRLSEERFHLLVEGIEEYAIFMLDPEGRITTWNTGAERLKGYTADEIIGEHFSRFYPQEDVESGKPGRALEIATTTEKYEDENWRVRKDGGRFWASVVITALRDDTGTLRGFAKVTRDMTKRKEAEEYSRRLLREEAAREAAQASALEARRAQLEESRHREQLHVTLASIGDAVIVTGVNGDVTFMNPVAVDLTGWKPEEAVGKPLERVFRIINEESRQSVENPATKVLREGTVVGLANHTLLVARDGREIPIDDSGAPIRGEHGSIAGVVLVFRDVTEARRAMEARLRLAAIVESTDDAIISKDLEGIITSWNRGAERLYGYTAQEMIGRPVALLVPPDHPDEVPGILERIKRGEPMHHFETVRIRKDGRPVDVSLTISPVRNAEGTIIGASKIARDITARKRNEAALQFVAEASRLFPQTADIIRMLQRVAEAAVPVFADWCLVDIVEEDGGLNRVAVAHDEPDKVELVRELTRQYAPRPSDPSGPFNVVPILSPEMLAEIPDTLLEATAQNEEHLRILRQLGFRSRICVPVMVGGERLAVLTFLFAESNRRFTADDLRVAEDIAQRAAIAIENARLYAELKKADRQKNEWIAMLAHELRNPLAPIRNALHIMKMPGVESDVLEEVREMTERQVEHIVRLIDGLLDVSRIIRGRIELQQEVVDLRTVIERGEETARPITDAQGQQLITELPQQPLHVSADPTRLAQVVANLVDNAAKFSERSGRIWLTAERDGSEAVIRVRDEGAGISPELLPQIFDMFTQGDSSIARSQGGLGIGLTVVRKLVELHGGTVAVHSEGPDRGSEFVVRLRHVTEASAESPVREAPSPVREGAARRILVVDDNIDAADSLGRVLRLLGHEARLAHDGQEALRAVEEYHPEVVVLDIGLPGLNGYEVAQRLRQQPQFQNLLLIAVTGYGQEEDRQASEESGIDHHLAKPVDPHVLQRLLNEGRE